MHIVEYSCTQALLCKYILCNCSAVIWWEQEAVGSQYVYLLQGPQPSPLNIFDMWRFAGAQLRDYGKRKCAIFLNAFTKLLLLKLTFCCILFRLRDTFYPIFQLLYRRLLFPTNAYYFSSVALLVYHAPICATNAFKSFENIDSTI